MTVALAPNEASTLLDILLENAELTNDGRYIRQFSDVDRSRGEYTFSGENSDFELLAKTRDDGQSYWELTKHDAKALSEPGISLLSTNEALLNVYARG